MRGVNKVIIIGTLGADPEVKQFSNGGSIANISVATTEQWTDKQSGEKKEATEWHRISLANRHGEIAAQYLRKGSKVYIEGKISTRKYQAADGSDRYATEIKAFSMQMLDSANGGQQNQKQSNQGYQQPSNNQQAPNPYAQQVAQNAQGMQGQVNNQFQQQNQNQQGFNNQMSNQQQAPKSVNDTPVDDDIPF